MKRPWRSLLLVFVLLVTAPAGAGLPAGVVEDLERSPYVYVASTRKDGSLGRPAEIWFFYHEGSVWVASPPSTWRVRRIRAGRTGAKIWVGRGDGASFLATGELVEDPAIYRVLATTFAKKYPERWPAWEERFRKGLADGSRVLIRYRPLEAPVTPDSSG